jgi:heat shock protein HtpX
MALTVFLLGLVYATLVAAAVAAGAGTGLVLLAAAGLFAVQLTVADKLALGAMGAREVSVEEAPELHATIERLCVQADLPKPRVAIADSPMANAFALGRSRRSATVCVTTGLLSLLGPGELEAVLAHELTHVLDRDVLVMTVASFFASVAAIAMRFGFLLGGGRGRDQQGIFTLVVGVSAAVYALSFLLLRALSRYREFAADRGAAILTGRPSALASALLKINGALERTPQRDLRAATQLNAFFIVGAERGRLRGLLATHPPLERRLAALDRLERQLQGTA